jgi:hypothetical protein
MRNLLVILSLLAPAGASQDAPKELKPAPDATAQKEAEKKIKDLFKDEYARKGAADRGALAHRLLEAARGTTEDLPALWVLLREAQDAAIQAGEPELALEALDVQAATFAGDAATLKMAALAACGKLVRSPADAARLAAAYGRVAADALRADQLDTAEKAAAAAVLAARRASDVGTLNAATARAKDISEIKGRFDKTRKAREALAKDPADAGANLEVGLYACVYKGRWEEGLPLLAKGSDAAIQKAAVHDALQPVAPAEQEAVADAWWDLADKATGAQKTSFRRRAGLWYDTAWDGLQGLARAKVEKRLIDLEQSGGPINLLRLVNPKLDAVSGQWRAEGRSLSCSAADAARLLLPYQPPEEYDLTVVLTRRSGSDAACIGLVGGGTQFGATLDGLSTQGGLTCLESYEGGIDKNPTAVRGKLLLTGTQPHTIVCAVRKKGVTLTVDSKPVIAWEGDFKRLSLNPAWKVPDARALFLGAWGVEFTFSRVELVPVTGQGKRLRA